MHIQKYQAFYHALYFPKLCPTKHELRNGTSQAQHSDNTLIIVFCAILKEEVLLKFLDDRDVHRLQTKVWLRELYKMVKPTQIIRPHLPTIT